MASPVLYWESGVADSRSDFDAVAGALRGAELDAPTQRNISMLEISLQIHIMTRFFRLALFAPLFVFSTHASDLTESKPWTSSTITVESGLLWQAGSSTDLSYRLVPTQLSWRSAEAMGRGFENGSRLLIRHRFTLMGTWVQQGPESAYIAVAASPSVEWWNAAGTWALYGGAGGGFGLIDSGDVEGGQGQDFTLHWFARAGVEHVISRDVSLTAGVMFLHLSNGGQTDPNPGIDAVGFTLGLSMRF